jgi:hypothetical protein
LFYHGKTILPLRAAQGRKQEMTDGAMTFRGGVAYAITTASNSREFFICRKSQNLSRRGFFVVFVARL